jgi:hypothetical protein
MRRISEKLGSDECMLEPFFPKQFRPYLLGIRNPLRPLEVRRLIESLD